MRNERTSGEGASRFQNPARALAVLLLLLLASGSAWFLLDGRRSGIADGGTRALAATEAARPADEVLHGTPATDREGAREPLPGSELQGTETEAASQDQAQLPESKPASRTLYRSIEVAAAGLYSGSPSYTEVLELAIDLLERVDRADPDVGAGGQRVYRISDDSTLAKLSLTVRDAPDRFQAPYELSINMPDSPGYRGPRVGRNGSRLQIQFGFEQGKEYCSSMVDTRFQQGQDLRQLLEGAGPTPVGGALTASPERTQWTGITLEATSTEADGPIWMSRFTEPTPLTGNFWSPKLRRARSMLEGLQPAAVAEARED